jgi:pimeloyl-ACP methyl ester carboxylesterase
LFPYGDHTHNVWRQLFEVGADLVRLPGRRRSGGREAAEEIRRRSAGKPVLLIGHSGGGVAAYQAAVRLMEESVVPDFRVVQVGCPKVPIRAEYREKVSYFTAVDDKGRMRDPVTMLGSWSGIRRDSRGVPRWDRRKYAPGYIGRVEIVGGHEHYFRNDADCVHPVRGANLTMTLESIWERVASAAVTVT